MGKRCTRVYTKDVTSCYACPNFAGGVAPARMTCVAVDPTEPELQDKKWLGRTVKDPQDIPEWCPLEVKT